MIGGILGAKLIGFFDIEKNYEMAFFIPLIAAMGGNVGVQSAAIVVQGLAGGTISLNSTFNFHISISDEKPNALAFVIIFLAHVN